MRSIANQGNQRTVAQAPVMNDPAIEDRGQKKTFPDEALSLAVPSPAWRVARQGQAGAEGGRTAEGWSGEARRGAVAPVTFLLKTLTRAPQPLSRPCRGTLPRSVGGEGTASGSTSPEKLLT
jgi:hypothetical protein